MKKLLETSLYLKFAIVHLIYNTARVLADSTITIDQAPAFTSLRGCAQQCLYCPTTCGANFFYFSGDLGANIGCQQGKVTTPHYYDSCFCRRDLASSASSYLSSCVTLSCSTQTADVTAAVGLYDQYCGFDKSPVVTTSGSSSLVAATMAAPAATSAIMSTRGSSSLVTATMAAPAASSTIMSTGPPGNGTATPSSFLGMDC